MRTQESSGRAELLFLWRAKRSHAFRRVLREIIKRTWTRVLADDCVDMAAQVSFYFVLSLFPFFLVVAAIVGWLPETGIWQSFVHWIVAYFPRLSRSMIFAAILDLTHGQTGFLSFGLLTTMWSASSGFVGLMEALTIAYGGKDTRGYWRKRAIATCTTVAAAMFFLLSFGLWTVGHWAASIAPHEMQGIMAFQARWKIVWWCLTLILLLLGLDLVNHFLPGEKREWRWFSAGTIFETLSFVAASSGLNLYVRYSPMLPKVYGTLAGFIILMIWIYLVNLILLVGAEIDRTLEECEARGALE